MKDFATPLLILLAIIGIALFGGVKNGQLIPSQAQNQSQNQIPSTNERQMTPDEIAYQVQNTQYQVDQLKQKVDAEKEAKLASEYKGKITMTWGWGTSADQEYIELDANYSNTIPIKITGWQLVSSSTGQRITMPQSTNLYFANSKNTDEDVWLAPGEKAYIITGKSPINSGLHSNICSGYLSQFVYFTPGLYTSCPAPRNENLSSIPRSPNNDNCFDLIESFPSCSIRTQVMDNSYSPECQTFIYTKLNYQSCVDTHKNDKDFYSPKTWYVYLKRTDTIWKTRREEVSLYDSVGKKVYTITR
jgi:hypothetical protein